MQAETARLPLSIDDLAWHLDGTSITVVKVLGVEKYEYDKDHPFELVRVPKKYGINGEEKLHRNNLYKFPEERELLIDYVESSIRSLQGHLDEALEGPGDEAHVVDMLHYYGVKEKPVSDGD